MKKIYYLLASFILLINIIACAGYKPIFSTTNIQFEIADYSIEGDKILGNKIYSKLYSVSESKKNNQDVRRINFIINTSKSKNSTAKDSAGKIIEYKIILNTNVEVTDFITNDIILNQTFISSLSYRAQDQYADTIKLEAKSTEDLINNTYNKLLNKLSQKILIK